MIKEIIRDRGELTERCHEWYVGESSENDDTLFEDLRDTILENNLPGLTANMIGRKERALAMNFNGEVIIMANPMIDSKENVEFIIENNLLDEKQFVTPRFTKLAITFQSEDLTIKKVELDKNSSILMGQLLDLLDGLAFMPNSIHLEYVPEFLEMTNEEQMEFISEFFKAKNEELEQMSKELSEDPETAEDWIRYKYYAGIANGSVETIEHKEKSMVQPNRGMRRWLEKLGRRSMKQSKKKKKR